MKTEFFVYNMKTFAEKVSQLISYLVPDTCEKKVFILRT